MNILQVNTSDTGGGAEGSAWNLFKKFKKLGHKSWLAVGKKYSSDPSVFEIPYIYPKTLRGALFSIPGKVFGRMHKTLSSARKLERICRIYSDTTKLSNHRNGIEDFEFKGSHSLISMLPGKPDIIHFHNLHGWYFDLRFIKDLSNDFPVILNLRDAWLLTGHCAYFFDCDNWKNGCGNCPNLSTYPAVKKDNTAKNWSLKSEIYSNSKLYIASNSKWTQECVNSSMLKGVENRVILNGIDTSIYNTYEKDNAKNKLKWDTESFYVLFTSASGKKNLFKDYETMIKTVEKVALKLPDKKIKFVAIGSSKPVKFNRSKNLSIIEIPFISDPAKLALYYKASDIYLHAAKAESSGKSVTEAMACGTPVVATSTGGITEQIEDNVTGMLAPIGDYSFLADNIIELIKDSSKRTEIGKNGSTSAALLSLETQTQNFLDWYFEILKQYD